jgi:hypothetical protein
VIKFCLGATNFHKAMAVARDPAAMREAAEMKIWGDDEIGNIWISGTTSNLHDGQFVRPFPFKQT